MNSLCGSSVCSHLGPADVLVILYLALLLLRCGDIEANPGPVKVKSLSVCHTNIRGLSSSKLRCIRTTLCNYDVITISETFLSQNNTDDLRLPGFNTIIRRDRETFGGGVAVYVKEGLVFSRKLQLESSFIENIWLEFSTKSGKILIGTVYRPPSNLEFWEQFESNVEFVKNSAITQNLLLLGDLNADFNTLNGKRLLEICNSNNLQCHVTEPTRITATTQSCLDQVISNIPDFVSGVWVDPPVSTNDHCTVGVKVSFSIARDKPYFRHIWVYDQGDYVGFKNALKTADWNSCLATESVDKSCFLWTQLFINIARTFIPNKTVLIRPRDSPWYTCELRKMKRKLIRLYRIAKLKMTKYHWDKFKTFNRLDVAENNYYNNICNALKIIMVNYSGKL